jgi:hypothetical protein
MNHFALYTHIELVIEEEDAKSPANAGTETESNLVNPLGTFFLQVFTTCGHFPHFLIQMVPLYKLIYTTISTKATYHWKSSPTNLASSSFTSNLISTLWACHAAPLGKQASPCNLVG